MNYTPENHIPFYDDSSICNESLRDVNEIYKPNYDKITELITKAQNAKNKEKKVQLCKEVIRLIDDTVKQLKDLKGDALDVALSAGSTLVSTIIKIQSAKNIMTKMSLSLLRERSITTVIPQVAGAIITHAALHSLTIAHKKKLRDKCVKELNEYKVGINLMLNKLQASENAVESCMQLTVANESAIDVVRKIKSGLNDLIGKIRRWLQIAYSWVQNKLMKLCKIEYIDIDVDYYNNTMSFINGINNLGDDYKTYINIIRSNLKVINAKSEEDVVNAVDKLQDTYDDISEKLKLLAAEKSKIPSPDTSGKGKVISVAMKDLNAIKKHFEQQLETGKVLPSLIGQVIGELDRSANSDNQDEKIKRLIYSNTFAISNLLMTKSQLCIQLINIIIGSSKVKPKEEDKEPVPTSTYLATI
jgi:hypothetical protein